MTQRESEDRLETVHARSEDFDELVLALRGWQADFRPLQSSQGVSEIQGARAAGVQVSRASLASAVLQVGATPAGSRTFGLPEHAFSWYGRAVDDSHLLGFHGSGELECTSRPGFVGYAVTVADSALEAASERMELPPPADLLGAAEFAVTPSRAGLRAFRSSLAHLLGGADAARGEELLAGADLPARILALVAQTRGSEGGAPPHASRARALERAQEYIREYGRRPIRLDELVQAAGVSERTLRYAFVERHGVAPKAYLQAHRLLEVRRALWSSDPQATCVADVANAWGFWHMGQLAADYRRLFGELPSETIRHAGPRTVSTSSGRVLERHLEPDGVAGS